jgi:hypothetical protein
MDPRNQRKKVAFRPPLLDDSTEFGQALQDLGDSGWLWWIEELGYAWQEAQFEATLAYRHWCRFRDRSAYAIYRAAQDRADAAQDALGEQYAEAIADGIPPAA